MLRLRRLPWFTLFATALLLLWLDRVWRLLQAGGLFRVIGIDFSLYQAQALLVRSGEPQSIYALERINAFVQPLRVYTTDPSQPLAVGPVPYPPLFAWLMVPFTLPPPPVGLALWTLLNLVGVAYLAWRVAMLVPTLSRLQAVLTLLVSFPVAMGLIVGQPTPLLGCAMAECYLSLRAGRDFRAGLWLAALLLKPQYAVLLGPVLIWKRRWHAVLGAALGGAVILGLSLLLVGVPALLSFGAAFADDAPFGGGALTSPGQMINWRALILNLRPSIGPGTGLLLTVLLAAISIACTLPVWRGAWAPASWTFPAKMAATALTTIVANYHSHIHGPTLFVVPLADAFAEPRTGRAVRWSLLALTFVPTILVIGVQHWLLRGLILQQPVDILIWSPLLQLLLTIATGSLLIALGRRQPGAAPVERHPAPATSATVPAASRQRA